jgi:predicted PurR-regulated permease PerM
VAALYFGRDLFVPLALAILLSFALSAPVRWLGRLGLGRIPSVLAVVFLAFLAIFAFGIVVAGRVADLAEDLPRYQRNIELKIQAFQDARPGGELVERVSSMLRDLSRKITRTQEQAGERNGAPSAAPAEREPEPLPVQIRQPELAPFELFQRIVGPLIEPLATGGIVIVVVIFMLLYREDLRDRVIHLAGARDLQQTTAALDEAMRRVGRYLLMQLVVNVTYAIPVGVGLWLIGVPSALLWALLALVLRFVPYIGPIVAAALPLALALAVDSGWSMLLWTGALFIVLEIVSNNFVEPWLYGSGTGLSPPAVIIAAIFWTWLWGPVGLLLSTPLTVCLVVLGRHLPQLAFLDVMLGSQPPLSPAERLYQRLLAGDAHEAAEGAEASLEKQPLVAFYDQVAIPALMLAERDRVRGTLDDEHRARVAETATTMVDDLAEHEDRSAPEEDERSAEAGEQTEAPPEPPPDPIEPPPGWRDRPVLCVGARGNLDQAAATMLAQLVERCGIGTRLTPVDALEPARIAQFDTDGIRVVCLSYMNEDSAAHARYMVRRLRRKLPTATVLVGFWMATSDDEVRGRTLERIKADFFATSLREALEQVRGHAQSAERDTAGTTARQRTSRSGRA